MRRWYSGRNALASCVAALLAACGGTQPIGAPGAIAQSGAITNRGRSGGSWMPSGEGL